MKKLINLIFILLVTSAINSVYAQPSAVKKIYKSVFKLITYSSDSMIISTTNGIFVSKDGEAITSWRPFVGANRAIIENYKGEKYEVASILGANEIYDIAKIKINTNSVPVKIDEVSSPLTDIWIVPASSIGMPIKGRIDKIEKFSDKYNYSLISSQATAMQIGAAVVSPKGKVIGMYNNIDLSQSCVDLNYPNKFIPSSLSLLDPVLDKTLIHIALPNNQKDAITSLLLTSNKPKAIRLSTIKEFIDKYPTLNDGYNMLANEYLLDKDLFKADETLKYAIQKSNNKDEAYYNYAKLIYNALISPETESKSKELGWNFDIAITQTEKAYNINNKNIYKHLQAKIIFAKGNYQDAYKLFENLTKTELRSPEIYLEMAQCLQNLNHKDDDILKLLDQSIALCDTPYTKISAPYFLARGNQFNKMGIYRKAIKDYYIYESFYIGTLSADFYYMREQCEVKSKLWQQALQDITIASTIDPQDPTYFAEAANLLLRFRNFDEAIQAAKHAIELKSDYADAYLVLGISQCQNKNRVEGIKNLTKAKELGNKQVDKFIKMFSK